MQAMVNRIVDSSALKFGFALFEEGFDGFLMVAGLAGEVLAVGFALEGGAEIAVLRVVEIRLHVGICDGRAVSDFLGVSVDFVKENGGWNDAGNEAEAKRFIRTEHLGGEIKLA